MQVDRELLQILNRLSKFEYQYDQRDPTLEGVNRFLSLSLNDIMKLINDNEYLGFQILKKWQIEGNNIKGILENPFIINRLEDEQIISIIQILKSLRSLELTQNNNINIFNLTESKLTGYKVTHGTELNEKNITYPDRLLF